MKTLQKYLTTEFESSSTKTPQFTAFASAYKAHIKKALPPHLTIEAWNVGHFEMSGFIKNTQTGKLCYISTSDVRYNSNAWYNNILIRTAEHAKDYTGGSNNYTTLTVLPVKANLLTGGYEN